MRFGMQNGYKTFRSNGKKHFVHKRVMEKKLGMSIPKGLVVHHINERKYDNRPENLVAITPGVHGRLHGKHPKACFICGHNSHQARKCYATWDYAGNLIER